MYIYHLRQCIIRSSLNTSKNSKISYIVLSNPEKI